MLSAHILTHGNRKIPTHFSYCNNNLVHNRQVIEWPDSCGPFFTFTIRFLSLCALWSLLMINASWCAPQCLYCYGSEEKRERGLRLVRKRGNKRIGIPKLHQKHHLVGNHHHEGWEGAEEEDWKKKGGGEGSAVLLFCSCCCCCWIKREKETHSLHFGGMEKEVVGAAAVASAGGGFLESG